MIGLVVRCDGSGSLGLGHVSRCLCLAAALRPQGVSTTFAMRPLDAEVVRLVQDAGFPVTLLPSGAPDHHRLGADDLSALQDVARAARASAILVDHYGAPESYLEGIRGAGLSLGVIDDTAERDLSAAQWVLNQNLGAEKLPLPHHTGTTLLLGPSYALLRPEFARARERNSRAFSPADSRVMVTLGGGDVAAESRRVLEGLEAVPRALEVRLLARRAFEVPGQSHHGVSVAENPPDMAVSMAWADLSVNAGGSTCWELACLGAPMVVLALSRDQEGITLALEAEGAAVQVQGSAPGRLAEAVEALLADVGRRRALSSSAAALVDGLGAPRAALSLTETLFEGGGR
jgi:UDP-2,4-diacetamido-2,4,6-trideoxy-beta-L-altropyranose hydrolase